jgi:Coenzyme PQQ synthesis protein D (PqqD)
VSESRFRVGPEIVHETVDGEVIAIDLASGSYYSLAGSGAAAWEVLGSGASEVEIVAALASRFDADEETIAGAVSALLGELRESGLIVGDESAGEAAPALAGSGEKSPFEAPRVERYTDMKDYFLLDPIHEVDTAGWPRPAA